jgi:hypothetical protein
MKILNGGQILAECTIREVARIKKKILQYS